MKDYKVKILAEDSVEEIENLCRQNKLYYQYCPPMVTRESILRALYALPPNTMEKDKFYLGFYKGEELIALLDLILNYPKAKTAFIGFFMVARNAQGKGVGTGLIQGIEQGLQEKRFKRIRLCYVKDNPQAKSFWWKNGFRELDIEIKQELYTVRVLEKEYELSNL